MEEEGVFYRETMKLKSTNREFLSWVEVLPDEDNADRYFFQMALAATNNADP